MKKLVIVQKKIIWVIAGATYPIFKHLRVLKLTDIYAFRYQIYYNLSTQGTAFSIKHILYYM